MVTSQARHGDVRIAYETFGDPGGEPLLLMMGLTFQMVWWPEEFCRALAGRGFHVARFDNRDAGLSTHFPSPARRTLRGGPPYTAQDMVGDAVAVLDALGWERANLFGESLGGSLAQLLALDHPARVTSLTSAMAGGVGGAVGNIRNLKIGAVVRLARKRYDDTREGGVQQLVDTYTALASSSHELDEDWIRRTAETSWDRDHDRTATARQLAAARTAGSLRRRLATLTVPTLVIHGAEDPWIRLGAAREIARAIPNARLVIYPSMGHELPPMVWPRIVGDVWALARSARPGGGGQPPG